MCRPCSPYRWLTFAGFLRHLSDLPDEWRWRFMARILGLREGFPQPTWDRCARHAGFALLEGAPVNAARAEADRVLLETPQGTVAADFLICATGGGDGLRRAARMASLRRQRRALGRPLHTARGGA